MIRAAIIDDRLNPFVAPLAGDWLVDDRHRIVENPNTVRQVDGHATTCMRIIQKYTKAREVEWHAVQLLHEDTWRGNAQDFVRALSFCGELGVDVLHLSIGSSEEQDLPLLGPAVEALLARGTLIVASVSNRRVFTCPACLPGVIGVVCDPLLRGDAYRPVRPDFRRIDFRASSLHALDGRITPVSNSYASPVVTAKTLDLLQAGCHTSAQLLRELRGDRPDDAPPWSDEPDEQTDLPVVVCSGFRRPELAALLSGLRERFLAEEYRCRTVAVGPLDGCALLPGEGDCNGRVRAFCRFFPCDLLLLGSAQRLEPGCLPDASVFLYPRGGALPAPGEEQACLEAEPNGVERAYQALLGLLRE